MSETEMELYIGNYSGREEEIFKSLKDARFGELLPQNGAFDFFYDQVNNPSTALFLKSKKQVKFFYADHDDFLAQIMEEIPEWVIDLDKNLLRLNLMFRSGGEVIPLVFIFDIAREEYRDAIRLVSKSGEFDLYFMSILYGGLVLEKRVKLKVPKPILKTFKSVK